VSRPLEAPVVVDPVPAGLRVRELDGDQLSDYVPSTATLYGEPTLADTLDGPVLLVGDSGGSANLGGPPWERDDALPDGLTPLFVGSPADGPFAFDVGQRIVFDGSPDAVSVFAVRAPPRLAALWGFWVDDPVGTPVRGVPGSAGEMRGSKLSAAAPAPRS
jgi:hypothetical protein